MLLAFRWRKDDAVSIKFLTSIRRAAAAAATGILLLAGSANAIIFVGSWDPSFGPSLPNLGFRGQSTFDVSAGCLTSAGFHPEGGGCTISLLTASLDLYNPNQVGTPTLQTLIYAPPAILPDPITVVFVNAALTVIGVSMNIIGPQFDTTPATGYTGPLWLQFILDSESGASNAFIYAGSCPIEGPCTPNLNTPSNPAAIRISQQIPEPGSLALLFGALGAGWLARRLRKR
jgi:hypothetical protein